MAKLLKLRRGTTSQHSSFTGAEGEVTIDTDKDVVVVHDGSTAGGHPLVKFGDTVQVANNATAVTVVANNTTNETVYPVFVDSDQGGSQVVESDTGFTYNPSTGNLTSTTFTGNVVGNVAGNATSASTGTTVTVTANESTDELLYLAMVDGTSGSQAIEADSSLQYNPSTGLITTTGFVGNLTGNCSGTAATVTGAAQAAITSVGTLSSLDVTNNVTIGGDLTVSGTTTTVNSTTLEVADKNIELGKVSTPTDTTADGGGITLKGATDKTWNWVDSTDAWTSSEHIHLGDSKILKLGTGGDVYFYYNGTNTYLDTYGGDTYIRASASGSGGEENQIIAKTGGAIELYHNNVKHFETSAGGATVTGNANATGILSDSKGDVRKIPENATTSGYTLVATDAGKCVTNTTGGVTIPYNVFATGDAVTIVNHSGSSITLTQGSSMTVYNSADGTSGNRTLDKRGMATLWFEDQNVAYISGAGLT